jgi:hypothetical protein
MEVARMKGPAQTGGIRLCRTLHGHQVIAERDDGEQKNHNHCKSQDLQSPWYGSGGGTLDPEQN